jgi:hypothetical protein
MTTETISNKVALVTRYSTLATAMAALPDTEFSLGGKTFAKSSLIALFSAYVTAHQTATGDRQAWRKSVGDATAALEAASPVRALVKTFLQGRLGKTSPELAGYGFEAAKVPKRTVAAKAVGVTKNKATRKARNTMGSRQKKSVKGVVVTTSPAAPSTASQPVVPGPVASAPSQGTTGAATPRNP